MGIEELFLSDSFPLREGEMLLKQKIMVILALSFLVVVTAGCGASDTVYIEQTESVMSDSTEDTGTFDEVSTESPNGAFRNDSTGDPGGARGVPGDTGDEKQTAQVCYVHVCGAVHVPGVYALAEGSRVYEALLLAGGLTEEASERSVNQAELIQDGQMIFVPTTEEAEFGVAAGAVSAGVAAGTADGRVNLNTASVSELMTLPGIGQAKAESIVAYREKNGAFSSVEEIMQVDGIKEGLYTRIKDKIRVK